MSGTTLLRGQLHRVQAKAGSLGLGRKGSAPHWHVDLAPAGRSAGRLWAVLPGWHADLTRLVS